MKFEVSSSDLLKKLQVSNGAIGSNPVLPVLEDFLFDLAGNTLTIASSDLETSIINSIEVKSLQSDCLMLLLRRCSLRVRMN